jgi:spore coat protein I
MEVLYADLLFPHWFYGLVKNLFQNNKVLKASEIEKISLLESSKEEALRLCSKRSG